MPALLEAIASFRPQITRYESHLGDRIAEVLNRARIPFIREARLGRSWSGWDFEAGGRIDFLVAGGIGIEVKKGKPESAAVARQVRRYCGCPEVREVVLVVERNVFNVPEAVVVRPYGARPGIEITKKVHYVAINRQGGIAL